MAEKKEKHFLCDNAQLMSEWDWEENDKIGLFPDKLTHGSNKHAHWICKRGHKWEATVNDRTRGRGCPICARKERTVSRQKTYLLKNGSLSSSHPELATQWHPAKNGSLSPEDVTPGSNKKVWWICKKGHEWEATICDRTSGRGCPVCANKAVLAGFNDLATTHPQIAEEWDYEKNIIKPTDVVAKSNKYAWWICKNGHSWKTQIRSRVTGCGCPKCKSTRGT